MNLQPILTRAAYVLLGAVLAALLFYRPEKPPDVRVVERLVKEGFRSPTDRNVDIPKLPRGVKPVAVVSGAARYPAPAPVPPPPADVDAAPPPAPSQAGAGTLCDLDSIDVTIRCRAELVETAGEPFARLFVSGTLQLSQELRELPEQAVEDVRFAARKQPKPLRRFGWTVGAGAGYDPVQAKVVPVVGVMWGVRF